ncbi:hypothetical protein Ccrd_002069, partial [Cynara cardunculus var. scolymus]
KLTKNAIHLSGTAPDFLQCRYVILATNVNRLSLWQSSWIISDIECFFADNVIDLSKDFCEGIFNIHGFKCRCFHKVSVLFFSKRLCIVAVSQIWAFTTFSSTRMLRVANSTPMVDLDSRLNSFRVNLDNRFDFPTPESPMRTTLNK